MKTCDNRNFWNDIETANNRLNRTRRAVHEFHVGGSWKACLSNKLSLARRAG
jgi:hypothetical protein